MCSYVLAFCLSTLQCQRNIVKNGMWLNRFWQTLKRRDMLKSAGQHIFYLGNAYLYLIIDPSIDPSVLFLSSVPGDYFFIFLPTYCKKSLKALKDEYIHTKIITETLDQPNLICILLSDQLAQMVKKFQFAIDYDAPC